MNQPAEAEGLGQSGAAAKNVVVRVFANDADGQLAFTHDWKAGNGHFQDPPIDLPKNSADWNIQLHLFDSSGKGLQFKSTADEAMWVKKGANCPTSKGNGDGQMSFGAVKSKKPGGPRNLLEVSDANSEKCDLHFMLCFEAGGTTYKYDPVIKNGGNV